MKSSMRIVIVFLIVISVNAQSRAQTPKTSSPSTLTPSACAAKVKAAREAGYEDGVKFSDGACSTKVKAAQTASFSGGFVAGSNLYSVDLGASDGKIPIQILIEDIDGADAFRLSAAELLTTYFSQHYTVSPDARLLLYVSGTPGADTHQVFSYRVSMRLSTGLQVKIGDKNTIVMGHFEISDRSGFLQNYSAQERSQHIKEAIYSVLTEGDKELFAPAN
jgi:hypothetical protein